MEFDPYHRWLGIRKEEQPPDHYRLLGLARFEDDTEVIRDATERQMAHVRNYGLGKHADFSQKILTELSVAKVCLLDKSRKTAYDGKLRASSESESSATPISDRQPPSPKKGRTPPPLGTQTIEPATEVDLTPPSYPPVGPVGPVEPVEHVVDASKSWSYRLSSFLAEPQVRTALLAGGGTFIAFLLMGLLAILLMTRGKDPPKSPSTVAPSNRSTDSSESTLPSNLPVSSDTNQTSKAITTGSETPDEKKSSFKATVLPRSTPKNNPSEVGLEVRPSESGNDNHSQRTSSNTEYGRPTVVSQPHVPVVSASSNTFQSSKPPIQLVSGKVLDLGKISTLWQPSARAMILKSSAYESLHDEQPDDMLASRSNGEELVAIFYYPNKSLKTLAGFKSGDLEGNMICFHDSRSPVQFSRVYSSPGYKYLPRVDWRRMHPMSLVSYHSNRRNGWLRTWNADQTRRYWCEYRSGRRHGPCCYFEKDQLRLVLEYAYDKIQKIHLIAEDQIDRSFDSKEQASAEASTGPLLAKAIEAGDQCKDREIALKKDVKTLDGKLAQLLVSINAPLKRKAIQERINRRAAEKDNMFRSLWEKGAGSGR